MEGTDDMKQFLATRRARITPEQAGLATFGRRRVTGLRREEVAMLAGVSTDYYTRLERGNLTGVSEGVLDAIAQALRLDEAEQAHLRDLARAANAGPRVRRATRSPQHIRPSVQRILDGMTEVAAFVRNARLDVLATNTLGRALYSPVFDNAPGTVNLARFHFLDHRAPNFSPRWDDVANMAVALLRTEAGRHPYDRSLSDLIGELSTRSEVFRTKWAAHNVRLHESGVKHFRHPAVGDLTLDFDAVSLSADSNLTLTAYTAARDSPSHDGLKLLARWAATHTDTRVEAFD